MEKKCPYCGEEIQGGSILCPNCGRDLSTVIKDDPDVGKIQGFSMRTIPQILKVRKPFLGGIGLVLIVLGLGIALCGNQGFPIWGFLMIAVGLILLVTALISGNIKF